MPTDAEDLYIYRTSIRLRNGKRIFAAKYGLKAFRIRVRRLPAKPSR